MLINPQAHLMRHRNPKRFKRVFDCLLIFQQLCPKAETTKDKDFQLYKSPDSQLSNERFHGTYNKKDGPATDPLARISTGSDEKSSPLPRNGHWTRARVHSQSKHQPPHRPGISHPKAHSPVPMPKIPPLSKQLRRSFFLFQVTLPVVL